MYEHLGWIGFHQGTPCIYGDIELPESLQEIADAMCIEALMNYDAKWDKVIYPYQDLRLRESELVKVSVRG